MEENTLQLMNLVALKNLWMVCCELLDIQIFARQKDSEIFCMSSMQAELAEEKART